MAYSRVASNNRGLSAKQEAQNERTESRYPGCRSEQQRARVCVGSDGARASQRTFPVNAVAEELEDVRICTPGARTRAVQPWAACSGARDALQSLICSTRTHPSSCEQCESIVHASMQGKRRPRHTGHDQRVTAPSRADALLFAHAPPRGLPLIRKSRCCCGSERRRPARCAHPSTCRSEPSCTWLGTGSRLLRRWRLLRAGRCERGSALACACPWKACRFATPWIATPRSPVKKGDLARAVPGLQLRRRSGSHFIY